MTRTFHTPSQPEGITHGAANDFYVGGMRDGTLHRGDLATGKVECWQPGGVDGRDSILGLTVHGSWLIACGGKTGHVFVFDLGTGEQVARRTVPGTGSFLNDVWVAGDCAYFTDSLKPLIWRLDLAGAVPGQLEVFAEVPEDEGMPYLNGIAGAAGQTVLLAVAQGTEVLWRVDIGTGAVAKVKFPDGYAFAADGLLLLGEQTLLGVCNEGQTMEDAVFFLAGLSLNDDATAAVPIGRWDAPVDSPTTIALGTDGLLLVVGSQLQQKNPAPPFEIVAVEVPQIFANHSR